jgi:hypothetical protein
VITQLRRMWKGALVAMVVIVVSASSTVRAASAPAAVAEGTIAAVDTEAVTIATRDGPLVRASVSGETRVVRRTTSALDAIRPNDFVGVTARREADGALTAIAINIFPATFRDRIREAQFVMDTGNIMTNATVFQNVRRIEGRTLYLRLGDGSVVITVPRDAEVFRLAVISLRDLKPGMRVVVRGTSGSDGGLVALTITVDAN